MSGTPRSEDIELKPSCDSPAAAFERLRRQTMERATMAMPSDFKYKAVYEQCRPQLNGWDSFRIKHPPMPASRWAKIFAPFDALKGFDEAIAEQEEIYVRKPELGEYEKDELDQKLEILGRLVRNSKMARENEVRVTVEFFEEQNAGDEHEPLGKIKEASGRLWSVDAIVRRNMKVDDMLIDLEDVLMIESPVLDRFG